VQPHDQGKKGGGTMNSLGTESGLTMEEWREEKKRKVNARNDEKGKKNSDAR